MKNFKEVVDAMLNDNDTTNNDTSKTFKEVINAMLNDHDTTFDDTSKTYALRFDLTLDAWRVLLAAVEYTLTECPPNDPVPFMSFDTYLELDGAVVWHVEQLIEKESN